MIFKRNVKQLQMFPKLEINDYKHTFYCLNSTVAHLAHNKTKNTHNKTKNSQQNKIFTANSKDHNKKTHIKTKSSQQNKMFTTNSKDHNKTICSPTLCQFKDLFSRIKIIHYGDNKTLLAL